MPVEGMLQDGLKEVNRQLRRPQDIAPEDITFCHGASFGRMVMTSSKVQRWITTAKAVD
jgi:hypothetical protein